MTYEEFIDNIIQTRGRHGCGEEYHEKHHIKPKCLGGEDKEENYIDLYAREHFIAHELLAKENPHNNKLQYAWWMMAHVKDKNQQRYKITPEEYEEARIAFGVAFSGENHPNYGKHLSEETRKKIREAHKGENNPMYGKCLSEEHKRKMSESLKGSNNPNYGKHLSEEQKSRIRNALTGRKIPAESRKRMSESQMGHVGYWENKHRSDETKRKLSEALKGRIISEEAKRKMSKPVICLESGKLYYGASEAERQTGVNGAHISECCNGKRKSAGKHPVTGEKLHWEYADK